MPDRKPNLPQIMPVYPLREQIFFPHEVAPITVSAANMALIGEAIRNESIIALTSFFRPGKGTPDFEEISKIATAGRIRQVFRLNEGGCRFVFEGLQRIRIDAPVQTFPYFLARVYPLAEGASRGPVAEALAKSVSAMMRILIFYGQSPLNEGQLVAAAVDPGQLADMIVASLEMSPADKQRFLETAELMERLKGLHALLASRIQRMKLQNVAASPLYPEMERGDRESQIKEPVRDFPDDLGDRGGKHPELDQLRERIARSRMPEEPRTVADKEFSRLERLHPASPEYHVSFSYLDYLCAMPWSEETEDNLDIVHAEQILNEDHYDMADIKERIVEFLAVRSLRSSSQGSVLCFVGPPGVGKTSLGQSIARALGRKFVRLSLGGMKDEAEIRGHRRTYIGAMPGRVIQDICRAKVRNPVFMLDEVDKIGKDFRGDPSAALLEVLDPEQNRAFTDYYLNVPFDLSRVMFITTANTVYPIPAPLRDRMEIIQLPGYSSEEKTEIAFRHLIPKQRRENGLDREKVAFDREAVERILDLYTREAGVRNLERCIAAIFRKVAREVAQGKGAQQRIDAGMVEEYLGSRKFFAEIIGRENQVGVATGLAWTEAGGELLFIETSIMPGRQELIMTGNLGAVLQESARAALSFIRAHAAELGIDGARFRDNDIHIHVPSGAVPKDGPSAGVPIVTALVSLLTGRPVRRNVAMTGEFSLSGRILPVGGVKEKVLAAHRAGIATVVLPDENRTNLRDIGPDLQADIRLVFADNLLAVLEKALC
ncbi:MAG: endopeptidase La [Deltaproteobacteria bacterium]|nr:endopeptidase La [Deltaproteobacteria bacterium]